MTESALTIVATLAAQSAAALVMTILIFSFHRYYQKSYLVHWLWSWMLLALSTGTLAVAYSLRFTNPGSNLRFGVSLVATVTACLAAAFLLFGAYELATRRRVKRRLLHTSLALLTLLAIAITLAFGRTVPASPLAFSLRFGVQSLVTAILLFYAAGWILRDQRGKDVVPFKILRTAFSLAAIAQLHHFLLSLLSAWQGLAFGYAKYMGFVDFMLEAGIALGMVACLLEDEREAASIATVEIEHLAYHDALSGLPNRALFVDRLIVTIAQAVRYHNKFAVLFLDLDRFKEVNDSLGHSMGDMLLKGVADRIRRSIREGDTVARFGGDEFTLLVHRIDSVEDAATVAQKITDTLKIPFAIAGRELYVTTSIGIAFYPSDGADADTLVRNADTAMYRAKEQGRDNFQLYAPTMNSRALERLALENMLRKAISQQELVLHYQPLVEIESQRVIGVEALLRWQHPEQGLLSPAHFISTAEVSGLILPIGQWVLLTACKQAVEWQTKLEVAIDISVNLSARQFQQPDLVEQVRLALEQSGLPPHSLELEITESSAMQNAESAIHILGELKSLGVRIAMDDFGTGYSSLSYLKRFPIDTLKLDQSFVRDIVTDAQDAAIAAAVISMAHTMKLTVIAEGVENEEQLELLRSQGCDLIQGYLFSKPITATALAEFLVTHRPLKTRKADLRPA
ncbi:MAG TPA: EAL domain-containing protein [Thermoanaerobaculia bacterium]|nr:EAL domain-containing protein [Thermoanaerobaculia bacterium]